MKKFQQRTKMNILEKMGNVEKRSTDEFVEECSSLVQMTFNYSNSLKKEIRKFVEARKVMHQATQSMHRIVLDLYDEKWLGRSRLEDKMRLIAESATRCNQSISETSLLKLDEFIAEYVTVKEQIKQRKRKASYFDSSTHTLDQVENEKKKDEVKINKAHVEYEDSKRVYEICNQHLRERLPHYYDERLEVFSHTWSTMFSALQENMSECSQYYQQIINALAEFREEVSRGQYKLPSPPPSNHNTMNPPLSTEEYDCAYDASQRAERNSIDLSRHRPSSKTNSQRSNSSSGILSAPRNTLGTPPSSHPSKPPPVAMLLSDNCEYADEEPVLVNSKELSKSATAAEAAAPEEEVLYAMPVKNKKKEEPPPAKPAVSKKPVKSGNGGGKKSETVAELAPKPAARRSLRSANENNSHVYVTGKTQRKVKIAFPYKGQSEDELSVKPGDIITVVEWENEDEQEDGWLKGVRESDGASGMFPENYSKPYKHH